MKYAETWGKRPPKLKAWQINTSNLKILYVSIINQAAKEYLGIDIPSGEKQMYTRRGYTDSELKVIFKDKAKEFFLSEDFMLMATIVNLDYARIQDDVRNNRLKINSTRRKNKGID